jgi:hypothetical protein
MKVLLLDTDDLRRMRICNLVKMIGKSCDVIEAKSLAELEDMLGAERPFDLALVGPDIPETPIDAVRFLRRRFPDSYVSAYDSFLAYDEIRLRRILLAGANMVFDDRMAPLKIALLLRPMLMGEAPAPSMLSA